MSPYSVSSELTGFDQGTSEHNSFKKHLRILLPYSSPLFIPKKVCLPTTTTTTTTKKTTINTVVSSTEASTSSSSPVLSSSSSTNSTSSYDSSDSLVIDESFFGGDHFYHHLQNHSSLLRIVLKRTFPTNVILDQWYRLDLAVLNEFGMAIKGQRTRAPSMGLACELLARVGQTTCRIQDWKVEWRPLQYDAWDSTDDTAHMANCTGFDHSSTGGLEFKITRNLWKINTATSNKEGAPTVATYATATKRTTLPSVPFYMMIIPTFEPHQTIHALPLVVGPITIRKYPIYRSMISSISQNTTNAATNTTTTTTTRTTMATGYQQRHDKTGPISFDQIWMTTTGCYSQEMYRAFKVTTLDQYFIIKEGWNMGTPGKMWDSALVISDLFVQKIIEQPKCLEDCHLLDLSAGTGTAGLLISFLYQNMSSIYRNIKITLTDLPDALPLITYNQNLNRIKPSSCISVTPLSWGNKEDIQLVKKKAPIDIIIASDVLYEPMNFAALVLTLVDLSIPGRTVIYLGYKRRGLKEADERYFFGLCHEHFDIQTLGYDDDNTSDCNYTSHYNNNRSTVYDEEIGWEKRYGKLKKNKKRLDGEGWLGSFAQDWITKSNLDSIGQSYQQTGVHIYRLVRKLPAQVTTII